MKTNRYFTKSDIETTWGWLRKPLTIPAGTPVLPAANLPQGGYWVVTREDWEPDLQSWGDCYGFHVTDHEVTN